MLEIDLAVAPQHLTVEAVEALDRLEPCGTGNPRPVFLLQGAQVHTMSQVGRGRHLKLRLEARPTQLRMKQAAAAVGQCRMMHIYDKLFSEYNCTVAQILLTGEDVEDPVRAEHLKNTFASLLELGIIPVVNENDSVSSAEIETGHHKVLGDNDTLSAIVTQIIDADALVILSDIDGLYTADPARDAAAVLVPEVREITDALMETASGAGSSRGTGGMLTKLSAGRIATSAGADMYIVNGKNPDVLYDLLEGKAVGTHFIGRETL